MKNTVNNYVFIHADVVKHAAVNAKEDEKYLEELKCEFVKKRQTAEKAIDQTKIYLAKKPLEDIVIELKKFEQLINDSIIKSSVQ